jgi:hypothetical protein
MRFGGGTQGPLWAVFSPPWPWWARRGGQPPSGVVGGGPRATRRGATGGAALAFAPGRAVGAVFFQGGGSLRDKWLERTGRCCPSWALKILRQAPVEAPRQQAQKKNMLGFRVRASRISSLASGRGGSRYCGGQQSGLKTRLSSPS